MNKTLLIIIVVVAVIAVVVGGIVVSDYFGKQIIARQNPTEEKPGLDPGQGEYVPPTTKPTSGGIAIPGWTTIMIPSGQETVTVDFPNPSANEGKYYLTFTLILQNGGAGEVLYQSGLVTPGLHIQSITLSRALEAGTYDAIVHVQPYTMDASRTATNNANMEVSLVVV